MWTYSLNNALWYCEPQSHIQLVCQHFREISCHHLQVKVISSRSDRHWDSESSKGLNGGCKNTFPPLRIKSWNKDSFQVHHIYLFHLRPFVGSFVSSKARFKVFMAMKDQVMVFWVAMQCTDVYNTFWRTMLPPSSVWSEWCWEGAIDTDREYSAWGPIGRMVILAVGKVWGGVPNLAAGRIRLSEESSPHQYGQASLTYWLLFVVMCEVPIISHHVHLCLGWSLHPEYGNKINEIM